MEKNVNNGLLLLRISIGGLMLLHGIAKVAHGISFITDTVGYFGYAVYIGEVIAPLALIIGLRTRIAALLIAANCIVATILHHQEEAFSLSDSGGYANELLALFFFGALTLFLCGGGKRSISYKNLWD